MQSVATLQLVRHAEPLQAKPLHDVPVWLGQLVATPSQATAGVTVPDVQVAAFPHWVPAESGEQVPSEPVFAHD
jgi:hypothetical protein